MVSSAGLSLHERSLHVTLWEPDRGLSDLAPALKNGTCQAIPSIRVWQGCWAHTWRAVRKQRAKLSDSSAVNIDELYTDLCFLHEVPWEPSLARFVHYAATTHPNP